MFLINSKVTQIQCRLNITGYSIAGKLGYSLKILLTAQYNQEKAIIRDSTTAWKTLPQPPLLSVLRARRLPFSSIVMVLLPLPQARWFTKQLKIFPLEKFISDDITYSYIAIRADKDRVGCISTKSNIKPNFLFITDSIVKYEQGHEDGRRFYWNQDESLSD